MLLIHAHSQVKICVFWTTTPQRFPSISSIAAVILLLPDFKGLSWSSLVSTKSFPFILMAFDQASERTITKGLGAGLEKIWAGDVATRELPVWEHLMSSPFPLKHVNYNEEKKISKNFQFATAQVDNWSRCWKGSRSPGWFPDGEAATVGPLSQEPSHLSHASSDLKLTLDDKLQEKGCPQSVWWARKHCARSWYSAERHLVYYACCDVANVHPVSPINVIHSTIACEAIELSTEEVVMDHNGNFNAQQVPLLEW